MKYFRISFLLLLYLATVQLVNAQVKPEDIILLNQKIESQNQEIQSLKNRLSSETTQLKDKIDNYAPLGLLLFLYGVFCALWAQNTRRNPWLWFFFGLFLNVLAVIVLLSKNRIDRLN